VTFGHQALPLGVFALLTSSDGQNFYIVNFLQRGHLCDRNLFRELEYVGDWSSRGCRRLRRKFNSALALQAPQRDPGGNFAWPAVLIYDADPMAELPHNMGSARITVRIATVAKPTKVCISDFYSAYLHAGKVLPSGARVQQIICGT